MKLVLATPAFASAIALSVNALPSDLNADLLSAVCRQDWQSSISIVDEMRRISPGYEAQLIPYRGRLESLRAANASATSPSCQAPQESQPSTAGIPQSKPRLNRAVRGIQNAPNTSDPIGGNDELRRQIERYRNR